MTMFFLNGREVEALPGESIKRCARRLGVEIPGMCSGINPGYRRDGSCRLCMVEVEGERTLVASCVRQPSKGMKVESESERASTARAGVMELLLADRPALMRHTYLPANRFLESAADIAMDTTRRFDALTPPAPDVSHPAISVDMAKCILCTNCVRACRDVQGNDVIGIAGRGSKVRIVFDLEDPLAASTCVACGECVQACPTGALLPKLASDRATDNVVKTLCPYCGVGCQVSYHTSGSGKDKRIVYAEGLDGPANQHRLCVKGRFGFDYAHNPERLTQPLIRKAGVAKSLDGDPREQFIEVTWDQALDAAANGIKAVLDRDGPSALAGFGSAKGSNEEAYLFQKMMRTCLQTNNVDHCTRLCHASSVAALMEGIGSGAVTAPFNDACDADAIFVIGARPEQNHPVAASFIKNAVHGGAKLIVADPRGQDLDRLADFALHFRAGSDVALLNSILHVIIDEDLIDKAYIAEFTEGFADLAEKVKAFSPEAMTDITNIEPEVIRQVARTFAGAERAIIFWGMGIAQHVHGTDNARALIALALATGNVGKPGTGLHPLRGQNNVQGASDAGLIPMMLPDYAAINIDARRRPFEDAWGVKLDPEPGLSVVEIFQEVAQGNIKAMAIMGENPAMSDPDTGHTRSALEKLEHLVVQDIFLTETAAFADVIFPASSFFEKSGTFTNTNRQVQLARPVLDPPGDAKPDLWILQELANRLGANWNYQGPEDVFEEMRTLMASHAGVSYARLESEGAVTYPTPDTETPGRAVLFGDGFPTQNGKARFVAVDVVPPDEVPDQDYPFVLTTGRMLEHWHTGAMTRRATVLDQLEPAPVASLHPIEIKKLGLTPGDGIIVQSRRGKITLACRADRHMPPGMVFIPFAFAEAAANLLTNPALDPVAKIAEVKYCAVKIAANAGTPSQITSQDQ